MYSNITEAFNCPSNNKDNIIKGINNTDNYSNLNDNIQELDNKKVKNTKYSKKKMINKIVTDKIGENIRKLSKINNFDNMSELDESSIDSNFSKDTLIDSCDSCSIESFDNNKCNKCKNNKYINISQNEDTIKEYLFNDDMKEIFVVLLLGVLIIFILDIFIRIGK